MVEGQRSPRKAKSLQEQAHKQRLEQYLQSRLFCSLRIGWAVEAVGGAKLLRAATEKQKLEGEHEKCRVGFVLLMGVGWLARKLSHSSCGNWSVQTSLASPTLLTVSTGSVPIRLTRDVLDPLILANAYKSRQQQTADVGDCF